MEKVLVGLSGGVDSTYAALSLREQGYAVEAVVLKMHEYTDVDAAIESADALGLPISVIDCSERFKTCVISDFIREYSAGRTPNPCVVCNESVKFKALYEEAERRDIPYIATGHYAKVKEEGGSFTLWRAEDLSKDQSYMLYRLPAKILAKLLLPLGEKKKQNIVAEASALSLRAAARRESQDICFVQNESYAEYIARETGKCETGNFVDEQGRVLGKHKGIFHYTIGQRKGLGISSTGRLFITRIDPTTHDIVLSDAKALSQQFCLLSPVFSAEGEDELLASDEGLTVKTRYSSPLIPVSVVKENGAFKALIRASAIPITPGQSAVFYRGEKVVLGGIIA